MIITEYNLKELLVLNKEYSETSTHYIIQCPYCKLNNNYNKYKLYITKDFGIGYCFRCNNSYKNKISIDSLYDDAEDVLQGNRLNYKKNNHQKSYYLVELNDLSEYNNIINLSAIGKSYLLSRNKLMKFDKYKLKSTDSFICIPFIFNNKVIYYQKRFIKGKEFRYLNPVISHKPFYYINNKSNKLLIVEGVFDAIASDSLFSEKFDILALLGSSMSKYQIWLLNQIKLYNEIVIFLDETALSLSLKKSLESKFLFEPTIDIIESHGLDPEEVLINSSLYRESEDDVKEL